MQTNSRQRGKPLAQATGGTLIGLAGLAFVSATPAAAAGIVDRPADQIAHHKADHDGGGDGGNGNHFGWDKGPSLAQTPELSSLALFGTGAAGMASYALARLRSRRHRP